MSTIPLNQTLPQSLDAEKGLLSSMLLAPDRVVSDFLEKGSEEHFFHLPHRVIYRSILDLWSDGHKLDFIVLTDRLEAAGRLKEAGDAGYITDLGDFVPTAGNAPYYMAVMREKFIAREAIQMAHDILATAYDPASTPGLEAQIADALVKVAGLSESRAQTHTMKDLALRALDRYEENHTRGGGLQGLPSGLPPLDALTRGFKGGEMIVIGGPTKSGKTSLALNMITHNAMNGMPAGIISLEMNADELTDRIISSHGLVDLREISDGGLTKQSMGKLTNAVNEIAKTSMFVRDEHVLTPLQFRATARKLVKQHGLKILLLDYLQLMEPTNRTDSRERQVAECSRTIKTTASELGIPIIVLSQLNDDGRSRESRAIEQDANLFMIIEQTPEFDHFLNIKYSRSCPTGKIPLSFRKEYTRFDAMHEAA